MEISSGTILWINFSRMMLSFQIIRSLVPSGINVRRYCVYIFCSVSIHLVQDLKIFFLSILAPLQGPSAVREYQ